MNPLTPIEYSRSPLNPVRPTIAPDVIVEQVSANANWNRKNAMNATPVSNVPPNVYVASAPLRKKNVCPMNPLPAPNMNANPNAQNSSAHRQVSTMHSWRMLTTSRVRANPASSIMNPACMKNTRNAATSVQAVFVPLTTLVICSC